MAKGKDAISFLNELDVIVTKEHEDNLARATGQDEDARGNRAGVHDEERQEKIDGRREDPRAEPVGLFPSLCRRVHRDA